MAFISHLQEPSLNVSLAAMQLAATSTDATTLDQVKKLVVIDSGVGGYEELVAGLLPDHDFAVLNPSEDGVEQISFLLGNGNYTDLAIVAHGNPGRITLGKSVLWSGNLSRYTSLLAEWGLKQIDLWSCQVAQDSHFIAQLASVTKAKIFASNELLGQGSWKVPGAVPPFNATVLDTWSGMLASPILGGVPSVEQVNGNGTTPQVLAPNLTIAGFSGAGNTLDGATVSITKNLNSAEDRLGVFGQSGSSGTLGTLNWNYDPNSGVLRFSGVGTSDVYQNALRQVAYSANGAFTGPARSVDFTLGSAIPNPDNGHYYFFVNSPQIRWDTARDAANNSTYFGLKGYLATVTSPGENAVIDTKLNGEGWMGASDAAVNKVWRWVTGPEGLEDNGQGRLFFRQGGWTSDAGPNGTGYGDTNINGTPVPQPSGQYTNWRRTPGVPGTDEPNDFGNPIGAPNNENYGHFLDNGQWNDYAINNSAIKGYVVEYGGSPNDPTLQISSVLTLQSGPVTPVSNVGYFNFVQYNRSLDLAIPYSVSAPVPPITPFETNNPYPPPNGQKVTPQVPYLFDETWYDWQNPDVAQAVRSGTFKTGYQHFLNFGQYEGRSPSILFDNQYYLNNNPDVQAAVAAGAYKSGFQHFLLFGDREERNPSAFFNQKDYLARNPDVQSAVSSGVFASGFDHYVEFGANEGRIPELILFQEAFYLQRYPDVKAAVQNKEFVDGYQHYLEFGARELRNPSPIFNEQLYDQTYPDVAAAIKTGAFPSGLYHYLLFGRAEGRIIQSVT